MITQFEVLRNLYLLFCRQNQSPFFQFSQPLMAALGKANIFYKSQPLFKSPSLICYLILYIMSEDSECSDREFSTHKSKHKIELCRSFNDIGFCQYGHMCIFAHGIQELQMHQPAIKIKKCRNYHANGYCRFGQRCNFRHEKNTRPKKKKNHYKFHKIFNGYGELILGVKMNCKLQSGESSSSSKNSQCSDAFYLD